MRRAYSIFPDPDVAAHLGEVLWSADAKDEARKIWRETLQAHPDSAVLQAVIKRFMP